MLFRIILTLGLFCLQSLAHDKLQKATNPQFKFLSSEVNNPNYTGECINLDTGKKEISNLFIGLSNFPFSIFMNGTNFEPLKTSLIDELTWGVYRLKMKVLRSLLKSFISL